MNDQEAKTLIETMRNAMLGYAGEALNGYSYLTSSADQNVLTVVSVGKVREERIVNTSLLVRVVHDHIIIEQDINSKPLVDALVQAVFQGNRLFWPMLVNLFPNLFKI